MTKLSDWDNSLLRVSSCVLFYTSFKQSTLTSVSLEDMLASWLWRTSICAWRLVDNSCERRASSRNCWISNRSWVTMSPDPEWSFWIVCNSSYRSFIFPIFDLPRVLPSFASLHGVHFVIFLPSVSRRANCFSSQNSNSRVRDRFFPCRRFLFNDKSLLNHPPACLSASPVFILSCSSLICPTNLSTTNFVASFAES